MRAGGPQAAFKVQKKGDLLLCTWGPLTSCPEPRARKQKADAASSRLWKKQLEPLSPLIAGKVQAGPKSCLYSLLFF